MTHLTVIPPLPQKQPQFEPVNVNDFIRVSKGRLNIWDGFTWNKIASKEHLGALEKGMKIILDRQIEHIEYKMATTMSLNRAHLFEAYQQSITAISERIRDQVAGYRERSTDRIFQIINRFMDKKNAFDREVQASNKTDEQKKRLMEIAESLTDQNISALVTELTSELTHYHQMCERIYVGMTNEIERHRDPK